MVDAFIKPAGTRSRRDLFRSIGLVALGGGATAVLAACSGGSGEAGASSASASGPINIAKSSVPEGSGVIQGAYVVTQPKAGDFKAFSSKCTHEGCPLSAVNGDTIVCNCHGSQFSVTDGSVKQGPAEKPLPAATVTVEGNDLKVSA